MFKNIQKNFIGVGPNGNAKGSQGSLGVPMTFTDATGRRRKGTYDQGMKAMRETHAMKDNDLFQKSLSARRGESSTAVRTAASGSAKSWLGR